MKQFTIAGLTLLLALAPLATRADSPTPRLGAPITYQNLTIFPVRGDASNKTVVPLTLQEAMDQKAIRVRETGNVNSLEVENLGDKDIFIQAGDIVKGGRQDRVLSVDMVLNVKSGRVPIDAFCVEHGRWSGRGSEKADSFGSSNTALPSRTMKLATKPKVGEPPNIAKPQQQVWDGVQDVQRKLAGNVGGPVTAAPSPTSLQLTMENDKLKSSIGAYEKAFADMSNKTPDAVGYVMVINGKINSADIYNSPALFQRMWPKLLNAAAIEAIAEKNDASFAPVSGENVNGFLDQFAKAPSKLQMISPRMTLSAQENEKAIVSDILVSDRPNPNGVLSDGVLLHRNYLAK